MQSLEKLFEIFRQEHNLHSISTNAIGKMWIDKFQRWVQLYHPKVYREHNTDLINPYYEIIYRWHESNT